MWVLSLCLLVNVVGGALIGRWLIDGTTTDFSGQGRHGSYAGTPATAEAADAALGGGIASTFVDASNKMQVPTYTHGATGEARMAWFKSTYTTWGQVIFGGASTAKAVLDASWKPSMGQTNYRVSVKMLRAVGSQGVVYTASTDGSATSTFTIMTSNGQCERAVIMSDTTWEVFYSGPDYRDGVWHHLVLSWTTTVTAYHDGTFVNSDSITKVHPDSSEIVMIGNRAANGDYPVVGSLYDVRQYDAPLSAAEVLLIYQMTTGSYGSIFGDPHFKAPTGGMFTITGKVGHIYSIISTTTFHWNMMFIQRRMDPSKGTNAGPCGFLFNNHTITVEPGHSAVTVDGVVHRNRRSSSILLGSLTNYIRLFRTSTIVRGPCFKVHLTRAPKGVLVRNRVQPTRLDHFSFEIAPSTPRCPSHGLLGQTFGFTLPVHPTGDNGENVIESTVEDYEEVTLVSTSSRFARYKQ